MTFHTHSGLSYSHTDPQPKDVYIEDIAHALSHLCRFAGHTRRFYSVAEHSVHVSELCPHPFKLEGLLHDASEAYCVDIPTPLKYAPGMEVYRTYERGTDLVIRTRYQLLFSEPAEVKQADQKMLEVEQAVLFNTDYVGWSPAEAKEKFLERFHSLYQRG